MVQIASRAHGPNGLEHEPHRRDALLQFKLAAPQLPADVVVRPRLLERLDAGTGRALTLLAAPAGFGKTTLLQQWSVGAGQGAAHSPAEQRPRAVARRCVWVALDAADNDPVRFWDYVLAALAALDTARGAAFDAVRLAGPLAPLSPGLSELLRLLATLPADCVLILDDYHLITAPEIHAALICLLERLPPQLHVVIASRTDPPLPLARLRVASQLVELRAADLRFSAEETAAFLAATAHLQLSPADCAALAERTEGWVAGLRLAALALQGNHDPAGFVAAFTGSHRHVVDYLADEVLQQQPPAVQRFLLQTSLLERFCGALCEALVDWDLPLTAPLEPGAAHNCQLLLEDLDRANLFLVPLDEERGWYRYQHLFAEFLQDRLSRIAPAQIPELHRRAAAWFVRAGLEARATQHALAGQDWPLAADLVVRAGRTALSQSGEWSTVLRWCAALPPELLRSRIDLCLTHAWALVNANEHTAARQRIADAEQLLAADQHADLRATIAAIEATAAMRTGNCARALELSSYVLEQAPTADGYWQGVAALNLGLVHRMHGNIGEALSAFASAAALSQAADNPRTMLVALNNLAEAQALRGQLSAAAVTIEQALGLAVAPHGGPQPTAIAGMLYVARADLLRERNDLAGAERSVRDGIAAGRQIGEEQVILAGMVVLARLQQAKLRLVDALETIDAAVAEGLRGKIARWDIVQTVRATQARLWVAQGRVQLASQWAQSRHFDPQPTADSLVLRWYEYATLVHVRAAQGHFVLAAELAAQLRAALAACGHAAAEIELLALEAVVLQLAGRTRQALETLELAVAQAAPEGYVRTFVDRGAPMANLLRQLERHGVALPYVQQLLGSFRVFGGQRPEPAVSIPTALLGRSAPAERAPDNEPELVEPLSERELQVLRLMAQGYSNDAIAERLVVAVSTVKWYNKHIFAKLDVHSRTQAVVRAQAQGLLDRP